MKKYVVISFGICFLLIVLSGFYIWDRYKLQEGIKKELLALYASQTKTQIDVIRATIKELPHIVKPFIGELHFQNVNIIDEYSENISLLEQFYIDNSYLIRDISVYNVSGDVFNIYREDNKSIMDVYKARAASVLVSETKFVLSDKLSIVIPVYQREELVGNVAVIIDIMSLLHNLFEPFIVNDNVWGTMFFDELIAITLPLADDMILSNEKDIARDMCEQNSGIFRGVINGQASKPVLTYCENLMISEHCIGVAYTANISPLIFSSLITFAFFAFILLALTTLLSIVLNRIELKNNIMQNETNQKIRVLQAIYHNSPVGVIVNKDNQFFSGNECFFSIFDDYVSINDTGKNMNQLSLPDCFQQKYEDDPELKETNICKLDRKGKEISLSRRQISFKLDENNYVIDTFLEVTEMERRLKDTIQSSITKSELLSRVGGNVKKTLCSVRNIAALLTQQFPNDLHISHINQLTDDLCVMLTDVQDYADIEAGLMELDEVPFNLVDEIKKLTNKYQAKIEAKGIELRLHVSSSTIRNVVGDPVHFRQILNELLSNAIKFTAKGSIRISLETAYLQRGNIKVRCSVEDTGQGIPREKLKNLFSFDLRAMEEGDSIGLGVIIVKKLVNIMGGKLRVASPSPISTDASAPGTQFKFSFVCVSDKNFDKQLDYSAIVSCQQVNMLFISSDNQQINDLIDSLNLNNVNSDIFIYDKESAELLINKLIIDNNRYRIVVIAAENSETSFSIAERIHKNDLTKNCIYVFIDTRSQKGNYVKAKSFDMDYYFVQNDLSSFHSIFGFHFPNIPEKELPMALNEQNKNIKILVVEYDSLSKKVAEAMFKNLGYKVDFASDTVNLVNLLKNNNYDIMFIDFLLVDGIDISELLCEKNYKMPIIAMTSSQTKENRKRIADSGIKGFMIKPLNPDSIKEILSKHMR